MTDPVKKRRGKPRQTKDRVLQARIPRHLDEELREHAELLGLSVSTVVRNVLLNTFQLVEGVVIDSTKLARAFHGHKGSAPQTPPGKHETAIEEPEGEVIGWQEAVLNLNGTCDQCNCILHKGERAGVGVPARTRPVLLCPPCLGALSTAAPDKRQGDHT